MRVKAKDRIGQVINGWKVVEIVEYNKNNTAIFRFENVNNHITRNSTIYDFFKHKNFGSRVPSNTWHNNRLRSIFKGMKQRCYNVTNHAYKNYGARGIKIHDEWLNNPAAFEEWALEAGYQDELTIDRIDINDNYEPNNCRWISKEENSKWKRHTQRIWVNNYCDSGIGWSFKVHKSRNWFNTTVHNHSYDYAYQRLLEEIEKLGGIKKVLGISEEEPDISKILEDISNDCLEV